ncbi:MAG: EFR1 family ferrodoxin [Clostridia bacterium]|nr:EFR1 family ferrodoxin [Clostridia bacterium]
MNKSIHIVYFSGTGGTEYAAQLLREKCSLETMAVKVSKLYQNNHVEINPEETLMIMYPVYAADAPRAIYSFINSLPKGHNEVVIIPVSGGGNVSPNTACSSQVKSKLKRKGYRVQKEYHLVMPSNFIMATEDRFALELIHVLPNKCHMIAKEILNETIRLKKPLKRDHVIRVLCSLEKQGAKVFGKTMKVMDPCTGCGLCEKICPKSNIKLIEGKPQFSWSCELCMGCIYACPVQAIKPRMMKSFVLKEGYDLNHIVERANQLEPNFEEPENNKKHWDGVIDYIYHNEI